MDDYKNIYSSYGLVMIRYILTMGTSRLYLAVSHLQTTPSFNDWTESGLEKEAEIMFRNVDKARDDITEMLDNTATVEWNANITYLSSQKKIYDDTINELYAAANLATRAGFLNCAAKAQIDSSKIILKHQAQVNANNDIFKTATNTFKNPVIVAKNLFSLYSLNTEILLFRGCNNTLNRLFINGIINCYKTVMLAYTKKILTVKTTMEMLYKEYEVVKKAYTDFHTNNDRIVAEAATETNKAADETLKCANLNKKSPLQVILNQIENLNSTITDYLKTNISSLETSVNSLKSKLTLSKAFTGNNLNAAVQPLFFIGKYLKPFGLTVENEININNQLNMDIDNALIKINTILSNKNKTLNDFMDFVYSIYTKYTTELSYVSEANLTNLCIPKDTMEQISKEEEIKTCLANLFQKFSNAAREAKDAIAQQIMNYDMVETDISNVIQINVTNETNNAMEKIELALTAMLKSNGYDLEMILQIIENHFSLSKYKNIFKNQIDIKANLGKIKLSLDSIMGSLNNEIETTVSQLSETIKIIEILNPDYNLTSLNAELLKWKNDLKFNIIKFLDGKYNNAINLSAPALNYDFDKELNLLLKNGEKCFPIRLATLISCFEPYTTMFNNSLTKATSLSLNTLTDTNNLVEKLPNDIKQFIVSAFNKTKEHIKALALDALNKANPGIDFRKEAIIQYQIQNENKIKTGTQVPLDTSYEFYLNNAIVLDRLKLNLEDIHRPLRKAYEKSYKQVPNQPIPWSIIKDEIEKQIATHFKNVSSNFDFFFKGLLINQFENVKNRTSNNIIAFTIELVNSNCTQFISQKIPFNNCILDISKKYGLSLDMAENGLKFMDNGINNIFPEDLIFTTRIQEEQLKIAENNVKVEIEKVEQNTIEMLTNPKFLLDSSQNAWKEFEQAALYANNIKSSFNTSNINIPFQQFQNVLTTSAEPIKVMLNMIESLNNISPSQEFQNIIQNTGTTLNLLLEGSSVTYQQTIMSNIKVAIEGANANIEQLRNQIIATNVIAQNKINTFINWFKEEESKFSESAANEQCKIVPTNQYKNCVKSYFDGLINKLKSGKEEVEKIVSTYNTVTINTDINNFIQQIKEELKKVDNNIKSEIDKVKGHKDLWKSNEETVLKGLQQINNRVTVHIVPTFNEVNTMIKGQSTRFNNVTDMFLKDIAEVFAYNGSLTEEKKKLISASADNVIRVINFYNNLNLINEKLTISFENAFNTLLSTVNESTFKTKCWNLFSSKENFNSCVQEKINQFNTDINKIRMDVNTISQQSKQISECAKKEVDKVVSDELKQAEEFVSEEKKKNDENNSTTSSAIIDQCLRQKNLRIDTEISAMINQTIQITEEVIVEAKKPRGFESFINNTLSTWLSTIDLTIKLNPQNAAQINLEYERLNKYRLDAINRVNNNIQIYLNNATSIEFETNNIQNNLQMINFTRLNQSCESVYSSKTKFQQCITQQCTILNSNIDRAVKKVNDLYNVALSLKLEAKTNINNTINNEIQNAEEISKVESEKLIKENNVTASQIITTALGDFAQYNIKPYIQMIQGLRITANQLQTHAVITNNTANNILNTVNILLNLHVYALSVVCPKRSTKNETDYGLWMIQDVMNKLYLLFPDTTNYTMSQFQLANELNSTLQNEIAKLSLVEKNCDTKDLYKLVACVRESVDFFGDYFQNATAQIEIYQVESLEQLKNQTIQLDNWEKIDVNNEYERLKTELQPIPEGIYNECNITRDKLLDFAVINMNNRKTLFNNSIPNTVQNIIATAESILNTNYMGIVNMNEILQESVDFIRLAINDVLASENASQITDEVQFEPDRLINNGINEYENFVFDYYRFSQYSIELAQSLQSQADELHKNTNRSAVEQACFNSNSNYPMSSFVVCNNEYNYQYELKLQNKQNKLDLLLKNLQNTNINGIQQIINHSNKVAAETKIKSATYAIYLYFIAGLPRPSYLDPYVKDDCLVRINGDPRSPCLIIS